MTVTLRDYQDDFVAQVRIEFRNGVKSVILVAATGAGKCLARGTPVLMFDGTVRAVEDVAVGDLLMGPDSIPRRVESLARGREQMYRVTPRKGEPYVVNESHILSLKITGLNGKTVSAPDGRSFGSGDVCNVSVRDYLRGSKTFKHCAKGWRAAVEFQGGSPLPLPPYILGAWLGDGATGKLHITTGDDEVWDEFAQYAFANGMCLRIEANTENSKNLHLKSFGARYGRGGSPFGNALRQLGIFTDKRIPHAYKVASRSDRLELLAGIIDADGYNSGKGFDITLKSEALMDDVIFVARSLGFACSKSPVRKTATTTGAIGDYWSCHIGGPVDDVPCRIPRKRAAPRRQKKDVLLTGITVEPVGVDEYFGFEISGPDRLFLLGDFTVTHNTVVFSYIARSAAEKGRRILILAHRDTLIKQASRKLNDYGVPHGIIMAGFTPTPRRLVQVASVQTLVRRLEKMKARGEKFDMIIIDEAHLSAAKSYMDVRAAFPDAVVLGVTGSPVRLDGKGLGLGAGGMFETLVQGIGIRQLIDQAYLVKPTYYGSREQVDLSGVKKIGGDYDAEALAAVMDKPKITGNAIEHWKKICPGVPAVAWCVNVAHAEHVAAEFNAAGVPALALSGDSTPDERDRALKALETGTLKIITFAMLLVEGVDCPAIGAVILLRPTMSLSSYLQVIGRGLRTIYAPGMPLDTAEQRFAAIDAGPKGRTCFVLDHCDLWRKHGFADDDREWSLDGVTKKKGKKKEQDTGPDLAQCPKCFHIHDPAPACPACGHIYEIKVRKLEYAEGELTEITPEMRAKLSNERKAEVRGAKTLQELERIAAQRGYKPSWAKNVYEAKARTRAKYQPLRPPGSADRTDIFS